jgi:hypothetical protein
MLKLSFAYFFLSHYSAVDFFEIDNNDKFFQRLSRIKAWSKRHCPSKRPLLYIKYDSLSLIIDLNF